jgi:C-terminal processing protease CtpA/Prc
MSRGMNLKPQSQISVGDEIVSICGENVKTRRLAEVAAMLVGPVGSTVECAIIKKVLIPVIAPLRDQRIFTNQKLGLLPRFFSAAV